MAYKWLFSDEEMKRSPSRLAGMSKDEEMANRVNAACLIQEIGDKLTINQLSTNTGIVYMQRFYMRCSFQKYTFNTLSAACLFLAAKVEDQPRKLENVARVLLNYNTKQRHHDPNHSVTHSAQEVKDMAEEIAFDEEILLQVLGLQTTVDHPHSQIVTTCAMLKASKEISHSSYVFASTSLVVTTMCLQIPSAIIACVCINIARRWGGFEIPKSSEGKAWFNYVDPTMTLEKLEGLSNQLASAIDKYPKNLLKRKGVAVKGSIPGSSSTTSTPSKHLLHKPHHSSSHLQKPSNHPANHSMNSSFHNNQGAADVNGSSAAVSKSASNTAAAGGVRNASIAASNSTTSVNDANTAITTAATTSTSVVYKAPKLINMQEYKERKRLELLQHQQQKDQQLRLQQQKDQQLRLQQQKDQQLRHQQQKDQHMRLQQEKEQQVRLQLQKEQQIIQQQKDQQLKEQQQLKQQVPKQQQKEQQQQKQLQHQQQKDVIKQQQQQKQKELIKQQLSKQPPVQHTSQLSKPPSQQHIQLLKEKQRKQQQQLTPQQQQQQLLQRQQYKQQQQQITKPPSTNSFPLPTTPQTTQSHPAQYIKKHIPPQPSLPPLPSLPLQSPLPQHPPSTTTTPIPPSKSLKPSEASIKKHRQLNTLLQTEAAKNQLRKSLDPAAMNRPADKITHHNKNNTTSNNSININMNSSSYITNTTSTVNNVNNVRLSMGNPVKTTIHTDQNSLPFKNNISLNNTINNISPHKAVLLHESTTSYPPQSEHRHHSRKHHEKHHKEKKHHHHKRHKSNDRDSHETKYSKKYERPANPPSEHLNTSLPPIKVKLPNVSPPPQPSTDSSDFKLKLNELPNYVVSKEHQSSSSSQPIPSKGPIKLKLSKDKGGLYINPNQSAKLSVDVTNNNNKKRKNPMDQNGVKVKVARTDSKEMYPPSCPPKPMF